jgi:hypothetical protein
MAPAVRRVHPSNSHEREMSRLGCARGRRLDARGPQRRRFFITLSGTDAYLRRFGFIPASPTLTTAMTSMFMHRGWLHLLGNVFFLVIFG